MVLEMGPEADDTLIVLGGYEQARRSCCRMHGALCSCWLAACACALRAGAAPRAHDRPQPPPTHTRARRSLAMRTLLWLVVQASPSLLIDSTRGFSGSCPATFLSCHLPVLPPSCTGEFLGAQGDVLLHNAQEATFTVWVPRLPKF